MFRLTALSGNHHQQHPVAVVGSAEAIRPLSEIVFGTCGWSYAEWEGILYPQKQAKLKQYCSIFSTVEIDSTFYALPGEGTVLGWVRHTSPSFLFSAKLPQTISHKKALSLVLLKPSFRHQELREMAITCLESVSMVYDQVQSAVRVYPSVGDSSRSGCYHWSTFITYEVCSFMIILSHDFRMICSRLIAGHCLYSTSLSFPVADSSSRLIQVMVSRERVTRSELEW